MIHIISPYAAVDLFYKQTGTDNETNSNHTLIKQCAGGKGINVARVLQQLDMQARVYTILGAYNGNKIKDLCDQENIQLKYIRSESDSRQHLIMYTIDGHINSLKLDAPPLSQKDVKAYVEMLESTSFEGSLFVINGGLHPGLPGDFYACTMQAIQTRYPSAQFALDLNGSALGTLLKQVDLTSIMLIKINQQEWETWQDTPFTQARFHQSTQPLLDQGISQFIVTRAQDSVVYSRREETFCVPVQALPAQLHLGAGDAFLGGFLYGWTHKQCPLDCIQLATAAASRHILESVS